MTNFPLEEMSVTGPFLKMCCLRKNRKAVISVMAMWITQALYFECVRLKVTKICLKGGKNFFSQKRL